LPASPGVSASAPERDPAALRLGGELRRRQPKTSERIARDLASHIVDNQLVPGTMLPPERDMIETLGVGRTTLREALRLLETRGVITIKSGPRGGPVVRRPRPADLSEALTLILEFEQSSLRDVFEARVALEPMLARLAARNILPAQLDTIQETIDSMTGNLANHDLFLDENQRFHSLVAEVAGNTVLCVFTETLKTVADGALIGVRYTLNRRRAVAAAHQRIVDALRAHDEDAAAEMMTQHLDEAGRYWSRKYGDLVADPVRWTH
jgi:GntR family transcriptional regulator, transcriptional repressor for pyruvate dehydrogenase complex